MTPLLIKQTTGNRELSLPNEDCHCTKQLNSIADRILISGLEHKNSLQGSGFNPSESTIEPIEEQLHSAKPASVSALIDEHSGWRLQEENTPHLVETLIAQALKSRASDIHLEQQTIGLRVRIRVDGVLHEVGIIPTHLAQAVRSRLKVLSDLDVAESRRPQDGSFHFMCNNKSIDVRVSTLPTDLAERVVLRLLDPSSLGLEIDGLGMFERDSNLLMDALAKSQGMVLVTGPTGSGKTTTLYAALKHLNLPARNVITVEDPVEYSLPGINQSQTKPDIGYTFAQALRTLLRQDPDVVMVGEIRDLETAQVALRAAMTGHLVLSTLHTNGAAATITRLLDLGAEPSLVASSISLIIAQRLARKFCKSCTTARANNNISLERTGCIACGHSGYHGRIGIFEVLSIDRKIQQLIQKRSSAGELETAAVDAGMTRLTQNALRKFEEGVTSMAEIKRVL